MGALLAAGAPALAQSINETTSDDITIERDRVDGELTVTNSGGDTVVTVGEVATPYPAEDPYIAGAVNIQNTGPGDATVTLGSVHGAGDGQGRLQGIVVTTTSGALTLDSGTVETRKGSGIFTQTTTGAATIHSGSISAPGSVGINAVSTSGAIAIDSGSVESGNTAIFAQTGGAVDIVSGDIVSETATGVFVLGGSGEVAIAADQIASGGGAVYVEADGAIDISSGSLTAGNYTGIDVYGGAGDIHIEAGDVSVAAAGNQGIWAQSGTGDIEIIAGTVTTAATQVNNGYTADGVFGYSAGDGSVTIVADKVSVAAPFSNAIGGVGGGDISITSGEASTAGEQVATIYGYSRHGDTNIVAGSTTATGQYAYAVEGHAAEGNVTIQSEEASATQGIAAYGEAGGVVTIDSGTASAGGAGSSAIFAQGGAGVVINAATATSSGDTYVDANGFEHRADAILAVAANGPVTVEVADAAATGAGADAVHVVASGPEGAATVTSTGTLSATDGDAVFVDADGAVTVSTVDVTSAKGDGIIVVGGTGDVHVDSANVAIGAAGNQGIFVQTTAGNIDIAAGTVTTAATELNDGYTADGVFGYSDEGSVTIVAGKVSVAAPFSNAIGGVGGGDVSITSGEASTAGEQVATIYGYSLHDTNIVAGTTTATGQYAYAVEGHAEGNVTIRSEDASATQGIAVYGQAAGVVTIDSGTASAGGAGFSAILAQGGAGVVVNAATATSSGDTYVDADGVEHRADAILAVAVNGTATVNVGHAAATGAGADAVHVIANGTGGAATVNVTGSVQAADGYGIFIDPPGTTTVNVAAGASVEGALGGLHLESGTGNDIVNAGIIASSSDAAAITAVGQTRLDNAGTISSEGGVAVALDATDDVVTLRTGSSIEGVVAGGGGVDSARLVGTAGDAGASQSLANFDGFHSLDVVSGYWQGTGAASAFDTVAIRSDATLALTSLDGGLSGVAAPEIAVGGTLAVLTEAGGETQFGTTVLTGTGHFVVGGSGSLTVDSDQSAFAGTTEVTGGTLVLDNALGGDLVTAAAGTFVLSDGGELTGDVTNDGTFVYDRSGDYALAGDFSGSGTLVKNGEGTLAFDGLYDFTGTTTIVGGSLRFAEGIADDAELDLAGGGSLDLSGQDNSVSELSGSSEESRIDIDGGALTVDQDSGSVFAGSITGDGSLTKTGDGNLNLTGTNTYTGPTSVTGGTLSVNGSITSNVDVSGGGKLGGNGTVGDVVAGAGGIVGPGNSIGRLNVAGDIVFGAGSVYQVEANAAGGADRIVVSGVADVSGATVEVLAQPGDYARLTDYTILTAAGGVEGTFADVTSNMAFLTPLLGYGPNSVRLTLARNDVGFATLARTRNQAAVAGAVEALGMDSRLYRTVLTQSDVGAVAAFDALSGEAQAGVATYLIDENRDIRSALADRSSVTGEGAAMWLRGVGSWSDSRSEDIAKVRADRRGMIGGVDFGSGGLRFGVAGGYFDGDLTARGVDSRADTETKLVGAYAAWSSGRLTAEVGGSYAWHDIDTRRTIAFPGFDGAAAGRTDGHSLQFFGEAAYKLIEGPLTLEPVVGLAHVRTSLDGFAEEGTDAALQFARDRRDATFASAGLRASGDVEMGGGVRFLPRFSAAYMHGWGDLDGSARASFVGADQVFAITGAGIGRDTLVLDGGFDVAIDGGVRIGASYSATVSQDWASRSARVTLGLRF